MNKCAWIGLIALACGSSSDSPGDTALDSASDTNDQADPTPVVADIQVLNPMTGSGMKGIQVTGGLKDVETKAGGSAEVEVLPQAEFQLLLQSDKILDHLLYGMTAEEHFELITFAGTPETSAAVLGMLGLSWQAETGMLVVGVDRSNWAPVPGAQVSISDTTAAAFVLGGNGTPSASDIIPSGGMSMVSFVNVPAGTVSAEVLPPEGVNCTPHPSGDDYESVPIEASKVTVISYRCSD